MAKDDVVQSSVTSVQSSLSDAFGKMYDSAFADGQADQKTKGSMSQADVDAAVAAQKAGDLQTLNDANLKASSDLAAMKAAFEQLKQKEQLEESAVSGVTVALGQAKASLDGLQAAIAQQASAVVQPTEQAAPTTPVTPDPAAPVAAPVVKTADGEDSADKKAGADATGSGGDTMAAKVDPVTPATPVADPKGVAADPTSQPSSQAVPAVGSN